MKQGPEILTLDELRQIMPRLPEAKAREYLPLLVSAMTEFAITTPKRIAAFLAQIGHETGDLRWMEELGNYCVNYDTGRLAARLGNTPEADGDGCRYKGRGGIHLTGAANYAAAGKALGLPLLEKPELAADPKVAFRIAAWFWRTNGCNELADKGDDRGITIKVNGGTNGLADRVKRATLARRVLAVREVNVA